MICHGLLILFGVVAFTHAGEDLVGDRIVGGSTIDISKRNFQLAIDPCGSICGGSLIRTNFALTAAHCTYGCNAPQIFVYAGDNRFGEGDMRTVVQKTEHPSYNPKISQNCDVSVLKLSSPYTLTTTISVISLATSLPADYSPLIVSGYGVTQTGGSLSESLMSVTLQLSPFGDCNWAYGGGLTSNMMCARGDGTDSCQGDSGGPITAYMGGKTVQVGVVSFGGDCADPDLPGVYANIPNLYNWIYSIAK